MNRLNWRRGTFRLWVLGSLAWISYTLIKIVQSCEPAARLVNRFECHFEPGIIGGDLFDTRRPLVHYFALIAWVLSAPVLAYLIRLIAFPIAAVILRVAGWVITGFETADPNLSRVTPSNRLGLTRSPPNR